MWLTELSERREKEKKRENESKIIPHRVRERLFALMTLRYVLYSACVWTGQKSVPDDEHDKGAVALSLSLSNISPMYSTPYPNPRMYTRTKVFLSISSAHLYTAIICLYLCCMGNVRSVWISREPLKGGMRYTYIRLYSYKGVRNTNMYIQARWVRDE